MSIFLGIKLSPKKEEIIKTIFLYRGITTDQLIKFLHPELNLPIEQYSESDKRRYSSTLKTLHKHLKTLVEQKIIVKESLQPFSKSLLFFLTKEGLEIANLLNEIPDGYYGEGYNGDYGDFDYELYIPPKNRIIHHLLIVDFFIRLERLKNIYPSFEIDYIDNRYAAKEYTVSESSLIEGKSTNFKFRPDGEVKINGRTYWIEVDRSTERSDSMQTKFEGYSRYMQYLTDNQKEKPHGVLFITDARDTKHGLLRRWQTISRAFFNTMTEWSTTFNLMFGTLDDVEGIVLKEVQAIELNQQLKDNVKYYFKTNNYKGSEFLYLGQKQGIDWEAMFSITQIGQKHQLFLYERFDGYETLGIAKTIAFYRWFNNEGKLKVKGFETINEIVPVFYHSSKNPPPLYFRGYKEQSEFEQILSTPYFLNIQNDEPIWVDKQEQIIQGNPLTSKI